jgi:hypothetical protein
MSTIKIQYKGQKRASVTLPPELINYVTNKPVHYSRYIRYTIQAKRNDLNTIIGFYLIISNYYYDKNGTTNSYIRNWGNCKTRAALKRDSSIHLQCGDILSSVVDKSNGRQGVCNIYKVDYKIYEDGDYYSIVSYFSVRNTMEIPNNQTDGFYHRISDVFNNFHHNSFQKNLGEGKNSDEFYHYIKQTDDNSIVYVTKDKFMDVVLKKRISTFGFDRDSSQTFEFNTRTISLSKLCARLYPKHNPKILQAHQEYTKMLSSYDESLFSIVTGDDITKYYHYTSYFKNSGDLGSSCMRHDSNMKSIEFYAKNSNVSLIIMKPKDLDSIMARALVWTTVDGNKVMDRIYTCDSKLVSLFHKYAEQNNIINIYSVRESCDGKINLTSMSPGYWTTNYDRNFIVDLDYLPAEFEIISNYHKFRVSVDNRRTSTSDSWKFPYMDNFNLINSVTKQASVMTIKNTFMCELTNTPVNLDNCYEYDYHIYNKDLVKLGKDGPTLIHEDVVTLDAPINTCDTNVNIPSEMPWSNDDDDWNDDPEEEEELDWDELEDIVTQQITNENNV